VRAHLRADEGRLVLTVSDSGEGIPPEFLPHVFDMFRQGEPAHNRTHGGLGLGLSIVRRLVELHGGTVAAASAGRGKGATFTVYLPHRPPADQRSAALENASVRA
jgi:signal transduction histidine kinase